MHLPPLLLSPYSPRLLQVWNHTSAKGDMLSPASGAGDAKPRGKPVAERLADFKAELPQQRQGFFFATLHYALAYTGLVVTCSVTVLSLGFLPGAFFLPVASLMAAAVFVLSRVVARGQTAFDAVATSEPGGRKVGGAAKASDANFLRNLTGWFTDVVDLQKVTPLHVTLAFPYQVRLAVKLGTAPAFLRSKAPWACPCLFPPVRFGEQPFELLVDLPRVLALWRRRLGRGLPHADIWLPDLLPLPRPRPLFVLRPLARPRLL